MDTIQAEVKSYILSEFLPNTDSDELTASTPLIGGGILDSIATVRLVRFLEEHFGIEVEAFEVNPDNFDTLDRIADLVRGKQQQQPRP